MHYFKKERHKSIVRLLMLVVTSVIFTDAIASNYVLHSTNQGWYDSTGKYPGHSNTMTAALTTKEYRSFFAFDIPNECASGVKFASLSVKSAAPSVGFGQLPHVININGLALPNSSSVGVSANNLDLNMFNDMGDGRVGQASIASNADFILNEVLNDDALLAIEASAAATGEYAIALALAQPVSPQYIMGYSSSGGVVSELSIGCEEAASILVTQALINDNGGTAQSADFVPLIDNQIVSWDTDNRYFSGSYTVSENALLSGYSIGVWGGDCSADGSIFLQAGQAAVCTITYNDMPATLVVNHTVINDSGGTATKADFEVYIDGVLGAWDVSQPIGVGMFSLVISALDGYQSSQWQGDCAADGSITLEPAQDAICDIVSTDMTVDLVLDKSVSDQSPNTGDIITFSIKVRNLGPDSATSVKVVDVVLKGLEYQHGTINGADSQVEDDPYSGGLKWVIDSLPVGVLVDLTFDALVLSP